jgi:hypothetical protein
MRGKLQIDLLVDPPPDLAIEIDITSSSLERLKIYAALGVKELWRFNGRDFLIYLLQDGIHEVHEQSEVLPILRASDLLCFLQKRGEIGENALIREFRQWLENKSR